ncbi:MAG: hypothetical protein DRH90_17960 [Deltaproteobacteria bacterium]|nr:MAG: hypothetical protein DRH90_17960 [Deltaproteobacteria bacterium]
MSREQSSIGSSIYYGPRDVDSGVGTAIGNTSGEDELVYKFAYDALPGLDADDMVVPTIPAGAHIVSASCQLTTAITGATDYSVGLNADVDALLDIGDSSLTTNSVSEGTGAAIGEALAADSQLTFTFTGTATAGEMIVRVKYYLEGA